MRRPAEFADFPEELEPGFGPYRAITRHIVDGDTADFLVDLGCNVYAYQVCRLYGIDAPETNRLATRVAGLAAKARLAELLPVGSPVMLFTRPNPDSFGRYLATVRALGSEDVGATLVAEGHAVPWAP